MAVQNRLARWDNSDALGDTGNSKFCSVKYLLSNALIFITAVILPLSLSSSSSSLSSSLLLLLLFKWKNTGSTRKELAFLSWSIALSFGVPWCIHRLLRLSSDPRGFHKIDNNRTFLTPLLLDDISELSKSLPHWNLQLLVIREKRRDCINGQTTWTFSSGQAHVITYAAIPPFHL